MALPKPTFQLGGSVGWHTKEGALLGINEDVTKGIFKPVSIDSVRNSGGTRINRNGLIELLPSNRPRIDFTNIAEAPNGELLVEPQRTNIIKESIDFTNIDWDKAGFDITSSTEIAPDGTNTATKFTENNTNTNPVVRYVPNQNTSGAYTFSVYLKSDTPITIPIAVGGVGPRVDINLTTEWQRFTAFGDVSRVDSLIGGFRGITQGSGIVIYAWGAQTEEGSYATSYIPTSGSAVTRNADSISGTGLASLIGQSGGSLYVEGSWFSAGAESSVMVGLDSGSLVDRIRFDKFSNQLRFVAIKDSSTILSVSSLKALTNNTYYKFAFKYAPNNYAFYADGLSLYTNTAAATWDSGDLSRLVFAEGNGSSSFYGCIRELVVFNEALSDDQLEEITTNGLG